MSITIKSIGVVKINKGGDHRWCSRVTFTDGSTLFAGVDNIYGKAFAEACHANTFSRGIVVGCSPWLPFGYHPITRERIDYWQALPDGWQVNTK